MSSISFSIPSALSVAGAISISGTQVIATGARLEVGTDVTNATLMVSDSGNLTNSVALTSASGVLAGQTAATGSILYSIITGISGFDTSAFATVVNLQATGQALYGYVVGLSGVDAATYATIINLGQTGQSLYLLISGFSGQANANFATITSLFNSGQLLYGLTTGLSGVINAGFAPFPKYTGNFTVTGGNYRYMWSGTAGTTGIATLPGMAFVSGQEWTIKNISTGGQLILSGTIDYQTNYTLYPTSAVQLCSDGLSFILI